jgi:hypothetical protein
MAQLLAPEWSEDRLSQAGDGDIRRRPPLADHGSLAEGSIWPDVFDRGSAAGEAEHAVGDNMRAWVQAGREGDMRSASATLERTMAPIDVPWQPCGHAEETDPARRLGGLGYCRSKKEDAERIAGRGGLRIREEGGHPAAVATDPEPSFLLGSPQGLPADRASTTAAIVCRRCNTFVHPDPPDRLGRRLAVAPLGPHP